VPSALSFSDLAMQADLLILTVYFICIGYVVYQMALSVEAELEDQVSLQPDGETLLNSVRTQLIQQGLPQVTADLLEAAPAPLTPQVAIRLNVPMSRPSTSQVSQEALMGQVVIQVVPQGSQTIQPIAGLNVQVLNQTGVLQATVDWDRSSFTKTNNQAHRVIRYTPGQRLDLGLPQVPSIVNPNQFLRALVTSENNFDRNPETQVLQMTQPVVNPEQMMNLPSPLRTFTLALMVRLTPMAGRGMRPIVLLIPFRFTVELLPARAAIPMVHWILRR
jgi:hypothetical protein